MNMVIQRGAPLRTVECCLYQYRHAKRQMVWHSKDVFSDHVGMRHRVIPETLKPNQSTFLWLYSRRLDYTVTVTV